eukprot:GFUD01010780.1.p1 GENE.GFUD01010780.1~~GFUD01010780.1.p1  ORF type:complete len:461 (+),score=161.20 GFUD01010780.1:237-1619(+)
MMSMMSVLVLVMFMVASIMGSTPQCLYKSPSNQFGRKEVGEVICSCKSLQPSYTGNMNFVKQVLSKVEETERNVDLVIRGCDKLRLELNFNNIGSQPINLRIYDTEEVEIIMVELALAEDRRQTLVVKNVTRLHMEGMVQCRRCQESQGLLSIQIESVTSFTMSNLNATLPLKLTGRHLQNVKISDSSFLMLPWPGIFFHNASKVELTRNMFMQAMPRSISISLGDDINISHNLLDVSEVLKVEQYEHVVIKCNRLEESIILPATCNIPIIEYKRRNEDIKELFVADDDLTEVKSDEHAQVVVPVNDTTDTKDILVTVLGTVDMFGLVWIFVAILSSLIFLLTWCCCRGRSDSDKCRESEDKLKTSSALRPDLLVIPFLEDDADEYSESSRVHLAQGMDIIKDPSRRPPQFVTVQGVRAEPQEDGVVCGSLTLGPSFGRDCASVRMVSSNILKQQTFSKV